MATFETKFDLRDRVVVDDDPSLIGRVTAVQFRETRAHVYGVSYVHDGAGREDWFEEWRIAIAPK